jgi:hypothetical protein
VFIEHVRVQFSENMESGLLESPLWDQALALRLQLAW